MEEKYTNADIDELQNLDAILRGVNFLSQFSLEDLEKLLSKLKKVFFKKSQTIIKEGEKGDFFYFISKGKVSVWIKKANEKKEVTFLERGEYFGETALISSVPRTATVIAEEDTECFLLSKEDFRKILLKNPPLTKMIMRISERRRNELNEEKTK
jgi:CRP-like cAMP-binding protein